MPSLTEMRTRVVPYWFATGVNVRIRLVLVPVTTILFVGSKVMLVEVTVIVSAEAGVSTSQTVKGIGGTGLSLFTVRSGGLETTGLERRTLELRGRDQTLDVWVAPVGAAATA